MINPIDEFALRAYVGRCSTAISAATYRERVLNGIVVRPGPGWYSADFSEQHRRRRELQRQLYEDEQTSAVAFLDVKNFFKTCQHDTLALLLLAAAAPAGAVEQLVTLLGQLYPSGRGLPVGFEGSGPLANLFLGPVDRELLTSANDFVRWTDDIDVFLDNVELYDEIYSTIESRLSDVHLELNTDKCSVLEKGPAAEGRLLDPSRDSIFVGDALDNAAERLDLALWAREFGLEYPLPDAHLRSILGLFRSKRDPGALRYLQDTPTAIDKESRSAADYVVALAEDPATRAQLDLDWLEDRAIGRAPAPDTAAGQLHMCRALTSCRVDKARGNRLRDFALRTEVQRDYPALGSWAVRAWSSSKSLNARDCKDILNSIGHLSYRRAAVSGFIRRRDAAAAARLDAFARLQPEVAPAIRYALTA